MGSGNNPFRPASAGQDDKHKNRVTLDSGAPAQPANQAQPEPQQPAGAPQSNALNNALASLGGNNETANAFDPLNVTDPVNTPLDFNNPSTPQGAINPIGDNIAANNSHAKNERKKRFNLSKKKKADQAPAQADPLHNNLIGFDPLDPVSLDAPNRNNGLLADLNNSSTPSTPAGNQLLNELGNNNANIEPALPGSDSIAAALAADNNNTPAEPTTSVEPTNTTSSPAVTLDTMTVDTTPATAVADDTFASSMPTPEPHTKQFTISMMTIVMTLLFIVSASFAGYLYFKNNQLTSENVAYAEENQTLKANNNNASTANNKSSNQFNVLQDKIKELTDTNTENKKTIEDNKKTIDDLNKQKDDLTKKLNEAQAKILSDKTTSDNVKEFMNALCASSGNINFSDTTYCVEHATAGSNGQPAANNEQH